MNYLVVVPAFNEENTIEEVIDHIRRDSAFADILVVDDGSSDSTVLKASSKGVMVISHPFNLGYGTALQTGFRFADEKGYDYIITMDADGQHVSSSVSALIDAMREEQADIVIGSRFLSCTYRIGILKKIGVALFSAIGKFYTGIKITDPTSGFQLLNRTVFSYLAKGDNYPLDYPDINTIMALHKMRFKVLEAPVQMVPNKSGKSMHSGFRPIVYVVRMFLAILLVCARKGSR